MKADAWMPLYIADYVADTLHLTRDEHGGYLLLLMALWRAGGSLPSDKKTLASVTKSSASEWRKLSPILLPFFELENGTISHKRVRQEREKADRISDLRREAGRTGGKASGTSREAKDDGLPSSSRAAPARPSPSPPSNEGKSSFQEDSSPEDDEEGLGDDAPPLVPIHEQAMAAWNEMAARAGLKQITSMNEVRRAAIKQRLGKQGMPLWWAALERIEASAFLTGATGWRASFDFVVKRANFLKITEGNYDDQPAGPGRARVPARGGSRTRTNFEQMLEGAALLADRRE